MKILGSSKKQSETRLYPSTSDYLLMLGAIWIDSKCFRVAFNFALPAQRLLSPAS